MVKLFYKNKNATVSILSNLIIIIMLVAVSMVTFGFDAKSVLGGVDSTVYYNGNRKSNYVSLMVNVYWGTEYIEDMLKVFEDYNVKTSFFIGGTWAEKESEILQKIYDAGHEIGNHGYFHKDHKKLSYDQNFNEINTTHALVKSLLGLDMTLFAPPSGSYNTTTVEVAKSLSYKTIMWSKDTIDWRDSSEDLMFSRATKNVSGGELILMHPKQHTLNALPRMLQFYKDNNLKVVPVSENIKV